ncbi:MAG: hypothetical protein A3H98_12555 [Bacteroidetes bacterium RIFCSPLOWO2_02_FULL_36_8]|nr:MAG: hypothetical protein A3H98_12555 [Bacteroidetes bacterium RIFCSPLOWO2_02_FULL_36_8]OFY69927.1 MAG: hypothetical protein A3G23_05575 [Bacteroidetes bacterium RIFCSPLOWO2_12_FULL_37_12]
MKKSVFTIIFLGIILSIFYTGCSDVNEGYVEHSRRYGGTFRLSSPQYLNNLYPPHMNSQGAFKLGNQIYEGLVKIDKYDLVIQPALANNWMRSPDGKVYTFKLREDVYFQNDPCFSDTIGRKLTAYDVEYSFYQICTYDPKNVGFAQTFQDKVLGANQYFELSKSGRPSIKIEGFKVIDNFTFQITLEKPFSPFLFYLAKPNALIFPYEAVWKYSKTMVSNAVGTGPFMLETIHSDQSVTLVRNPRYWKKDEDENQLPYLEKISVFFNEEEKNEFTSFKNGDLDFLSNVPKDFMDDVFDREMKLTPQFSKYEIYKVNICLSVYFQMIITKKPFQDKRIRKAFNYAVDKNLLLEYIVGNTNYIPAIHGVSPPTFKNYKIEKINGYEYNPELAEQLMAEAGYPNGVGFPVIKMVIVERGKNVAEAVAKMLEDNLNIKIELQLAPTFKDKIENSKFGHADLYHAGWYADYPSPENFLALFYGKDVPVDTLLPSYPNVTRYKNPVFDSLFNSAIHSADEGESYRLFLEAEQVMVDDAPIIMLYFPVYNTLANKNFVNLPMNPLSYFDFSDVYFKK